MSELSPHSGCRRPRLNHDLTGKDTWAIRVFARAELDDFSNTVETETLVHSGPARQRSAHQPTPAKMVSLLCGVPMEKVGAAADGKLNCR